MKPSRSPRVPEFGRPDTTEFEFAGVTHRVADVPPMDVDGVRTMTVGTILWAIVVLALIPFWGTLRNDGNEWWLWTAIAGFGFGLVGIEYCRMRRDSLVEATENTTVPTTAPESAPEAMTPETEQETPTARGKAVAVAFAVDSPTQDDTASQQDPDAVSRTDGTGNDEDRAARPTGGRRRIADTETEDDPVTTTGTRIRRIDDSMTEPPEEPPPYAGKRRKN